MSDKKDTVLAKPSSNKVKISVSRTPKDAQETNLVPQGAGTSTNARSQRRNTLASTAPPPVHPVTSSRQLAKGPSHTSSAPNLSTTSNTNVPTVTTSRTPSGSRQRPSFSATALAQTTPISSSPPPDAPALAIEVQDKDKLIISTQESTTAILTLNENENTAGGAQGEYKDPQEQESSVLLVSNTPAPSSNTNESVKVVINESPSEPPPTPSSSSRKRTMSKTSGSGLRPSSGSSRSAGGPFQSPVRTPGVGKSTTTDVRAFVERRFSFLDQPSLISTLPAEEHNTREGQLRQLLADTETLFKLEMKRAVDEFEFKVRSMERRHGEDMQRREKELNALLRDVQASQHEQTSLKIEEVERTFEQRLAELEKEKMLLMLRQNEEHWRQVQDYDDRFSSEILKRVNELQREATERESKQREYYTHQASELEQMYIKRMKEKEEKLRTELARIDKERQREYIYRLDEERSRMQTEFEQRTKELQAEYELTNPAVSPPPTAESPEIVLNPNSADHHQSENSAPLSGVVVVTVSSEFKERAKELATLRESYEKELSEVREFYKVQFEQVRQRYERDVASQTQELSNRYEELLHEKDAKTNLDIKLLSEGYAKTLSQTEALYRDTLTRRALDQQKHFEEEIARRNQELTHAFELKIQTLEASHNDRTQREAENHQRLLADKEAQVREEAKEELQRALHSQEEQFSERLAEVETKLNFETQERVKLRALFLEYDSRYQSQMIEKQREYELHLDSLESDLANQLQTTQTELSTLRQTIELERAQHQEALQRLTVRGVGGSNSNGNSSAEIASLQESILKLKQELADQETERSNELEVLKREWEEQCQRSKADHDGEVARLTERHKLEVDRVREGLMTKLKEQSESHNAQVSLLKTSHKSEMDFVRTHYESEIEKMSLNFEHMLSTQRSEILSLQKQEIEKSMQDLERQLSLSNETEKKRLEMLTQSLRESHAQELSTLKQQHSEAITLSQRSFELRLEKMKEQCENDLIEAKKAHERACEEIKVSMERQRAEEKEKWDMESLKARAAIEGQYQDKMSAQLRENNALTTQIRDLDMQLKKAAFDREMEVTRLRLSAEQKLFDFKEKCDKDQAQEREEFEKELLRQKEGFDEMLARKHREFEMRLATQRNELETAFAKESLQSNELKKLVETEAQAKVQEMIAQFQLQLSEKEKTILELTQKAESLTQQSQQHATAMDVETQALKVHNDHAVEALTTSLGQELKKRTLLESDLKNAKAELEKTQKELSALQLSFDDLKTKEQHANDIRATHKRELTQIVDKYEGLLMDVESAYSAQMMNYEELHKLEQREWKQTEERLLTEIESLTQMYKPGLGQPQPETDGFSSGGQTTTLHTPRSSSATAAAISDLEKVWQERLHSAAEEHKVQLQSALLNAQMELDHKARSHQVAIEILELDHRKRETELRQQLENECKKKLEKKLLALMTRLQEHATRREEEREEIQSNASGSSATPSLSQPEFSVPIMTTTAADPSELQVISLEADFFSDNVPLFSARGRPKVSAAELALKTSNHVLSPDGNGTALESMESDLLELAAEMLFADGEWEGDESDFHYDNTATNNTSDFRYAPSVTESESHLSDFEGERPSPINSQRRGASVLGVTSIESQGTLVVTGKISASGTNSIASATPLSARSLSDQPPLTTATVGGAQMSSLGGLTRSASQISFSESVVSSELYGGSNGGGGGIASTAGAVGFAGGLRKRFGLSSDDEDQAPTFTSNLRQHESNALLPTSSSVLHLTSASHSSASAAALIAALRENGGPLNDPSELESIQQESLQREKEFISKIEELVSRLKTQEEEHSRHLKDAEERLRSHYHALYVSRQRTLEDRLRVELESRVRAELEAMAMSDAEQKLRSEMAEKVASQINVYLQQAKSSGQKLRSEALGLARDAAPQPPS